MYFIVSIRCLYALFDTGYSEELFDERLNTTILVHKRTLPYRIWLPLDTTRSPTFEIVFFLQPVTLTLYGYYIGLMDSMVYGMMIHMNTQYLILKRVLDRYVFIATNLVSKSLQGKGTQSNGDGVISLPPGYERIDLLNEDVQEKVEEIVHHCAKHHVQILEFCEEVEIEFSYLMLSQFLFSLYTLCFQLYQLSLVSIRHWSSYRNKIPILSRWATSSVSILSACVSI